MQVDIYDGRKTVVGWVHFTASASLNTMLVIFVV